MTLLSLSEVLSNSAGDAAAALMGTGNAGDAATRGGDGAAV